MLAAFEQSSRDILHFLDCQSDIKRPVEQHPSDVVPLSVV